MKVSVIVPVYMVESFIERCIRSLLEQTLRGVEFIIVDDCSLDESINIARRVVREYPDRVVKFVHHSKNKGLPAARNSGLEIAVGEYVFHCDSDDWVNPDMLEYLYRTAKDKNADIVWCDWFLSFEKNERYMVQPQYATPIDAVKGMLCGAMKYNVWNKLIRRELYQANAIRFPSGFGMGEDMTIIKLFACAKTITYLPKAFYHYVKCNNTAFSNTYSDRHLIELRHNVDDVLCFLASRYNDKLTNEIQLFKLEVKFPFLISDDVEKYFLWKTWYPEANFYIRKSNIMGLHRYILQLFALNGHFWLIKLYYRIVHKFVYGIIFK